MRSFKTIAITGGIGSGKSEVSAIIRSLGYVVFDADKIYSEIVCDENFVAGIYDALSIKPEKDCGKIVFDRKKVSEVVFSDKKKLDILNEYTHTEVYKRIKSIIDSHEGDAPLFFEIPLLFESGKENDFDEVIVVKRPLSERVQAVRDRSALSCDAILSRIKNQIDYDNLDFSGHTVIVNDEDLSSLAKKTVSALERVL